jgi:hypothetical protein
MALSRTRVLFWWRLSESLRSARLCFISRSACLMRRSRSASEDIVRRVYIGNDLPDLDERHIAAFDAATAHSRRTPLKKSSSVSSRNQNLTDPADCCRWVRRARNVELAPAAKTSESRRKVPLRQPLSIVDTTLWTLARLGGINDVSILAAIRRLHVVARWPRILRPQHIGATIGTFLRPNQGVFHGRLPGRI